MWVEVTVAVPAKPRRSFLEVDHGDNGTRWAHCKDRRRRHHARLVRVANKWLAPSALSVAPELASLTGAHTHICASWRLTILQRKTTSATARARAIGSPECSTKQLREKSNKFGRYFGKSEKYPTCTQNCQRCT